MICNFFLLSIQLLIKMVEARQVENYYANFVQITENWYGIKPINLFDEHRESFLAEREDHINQNDPRQ